MFYLIARFRGDDQRFKFCETFNNDEHGYECAYETAVEILLGNYNAVWENEFDFVEICRGRQVIATVDESEVWA